MYQFKVEERRRQVASLLARSMTEREIAAELNTSQPTIHRDVVALKEMSQQFVFSLAKSDLSFYYKRSLDGIEEATREAWRCGSEAEKRYRTLYSRRTQEGISVEV